MIMRRLSMGGAVMLGLLLLYFSATVRAETAPTTPTPVEPISVTTTTDIETCLDCHGYQGFAVPTGKTGESPKRALHVQSTSFKKSVHAKVKCVSCHVDIKQMPHKDNVERSVDCVSCHKELSDKDREEAQVEVHVTRNLTHSMVGLPSTVPMVQKSKLDTNAAHYLASIHAQPNKDNPDKLNATCWDCHGEHTIFPMEGKTKDSFRINSPETCGGCHQEQLKEYTQSVHGAPVKRYGDLEPAVCSDCHTAHKISVVEEDTAKLTITENCGTCHEDYYKSYSETYHGQIVILGYTHTAKCHDCHSPHDTHKADDPLSMIHENNILETCQECHKDATEGYFPNSHIEPQRRF